MIMLKVISLPKVILIPTEILNFGLVTGINKKVYGISFELML